MKLLHIIDSMDPRLGGVSQAVRTLVAALDENMVHNEVACLDSPNQPCLAEDNFTIHALGPGIGPWSYSAKLTPWLIEHLSEYDSVILHGLWLYNGYALYKALRVNNRKKIKQPKLYVMPHGMLDPYFQRSKSRKLKAIRNALYWRLIERRIVKFADGLLFTCEEERLLAHEPFRPYKPKREIVVGLGIEEPPAYNQLMQNALFTICPELQNQSYILYLGRIHSKKGVDLLIKSYIKIAEEVFKTRKFNNVGLTDRKGRVEELLNDQFPRLVIAGPGIETAYGLFIKDLVVNSDFAQRLVFFTGMLTGNAKWGAFYNCDAFILPSHQENFGISVVEALACGKPVLISNKVNIWREVKKAGSGLVAEDSQNGVFELLEEWQQLLPKQKHIMSNNARTTFKQFFSVEPTVKTLMNVMQL